MRRQLDHSGDVLPTTARYLRLRALTEAGTRGPWTSATELTPLGW